MNRTPMSMPPSTVGIILITVTTAILAFFVALVGIVLFG